MNARKIYLEREKKMLQKTAFGYPFPAFSKVWKWTSKICKRKWSAITRLNVPNICHFFKKSHVFMVKDAKNFYKYAISSKKYIFNSYLRFYPENMTYFEK